MISALLYFLMCTLQPICLPIPEAATVICGTRNLGPMLSVLLGVAGAITGISIMYSIAKKGGDSVVNRLAPEKKLNQYRCYVKKHANLITGILFVIPILPDEIVCIGAAVTGITYKKLIVIAVLFKTISITMIAYSTEISTLLLDFLHNSI